ncbi:MAG: DUF6259 domain-containing protein [Bacteroidales bacterium]
MKNRLFLLCVLLIVSLFEAGAQETVITDNGDFIALRGKQASLIVKKGDSFDISRLDQGGHCLISAEGSNSFPWVITYKGPQGENPVFNPSHAVYKGVRQEHRDSVDALVFTWDLRLTYEITVPVIMTVSLPEESELLHWDISCGTPQGWVVSSLQFPKVTVSRPREAKLITSAGWGAEYELDYPRQYNSSYPSVTGAMQLMLLHNPEGCLYYATEDVNGCGKNLNASVSDKTVTLFSDIVASESWSEGTFSLPWTTVTGYSPKGWADAAEKWYRPFSFTTEWGSKSLKSRNIPQWLQDTDTWIRAKGVTRNVADAVGKSIDLYGKNTFVHWYYWHNYPYDTHYPDYFPAKEGFKQMIADLRERDCHTVPYINGRLWDPASDSYSALNGATASCRKPDGTLYTEIYPTSKVINTVTCPASKLWQGIIAGLVDRIQAELGTDGVYIDQVSAAAPQPCWAENHGHSSGGGDYWHKSYRNLVDSIRTHILKDGNILVSEENAECYIDMFDVLLTVNSPHSGCKIVPLFPLVYSDRVITAAYTYSPADRVNRGDFLYETMQCFLFGSQLGWVDPTLLMKDEAKREATFLKTLSDLRRRQHDVFIGGRYMREIIPSGDNPVVDVPGFGPFNVVAGSQWLSASGKTVQYYVNMDSVDHQVTLPDNRTIVLKALRGIRLDID